MRSQAVLEHRIVLYGIVPRVFHGIGDDEGIAPVLGKNLVRFRICGVCRRIVHHCAYSGGAPGRVQTGFFVRQVVQPENENAVPQRVGIDDIGEPDPNSRLEAEAIKLIYQRQFRAGARLFAAVRQRHVDSQPGLLRRVGSRQSIGGERTDVERRGFEADSGVAGSLQDDAGNKPEHSGPHLFVQSSGVRIYLPPGSNRYPLSVSRPGWPVFGSRGHVS